VQGVSRLKLGYWGIKGYLKQQKQEFLAWLKTCSYWSAEEVVEHLERNYNVIFKSKQSYYNLLHIAGLS
jgi:putative transposase